HGESLLRQALYGQRYFERTFGRRTRVAWSPGAAYAAWSVPQILLNSGFDSVITGAVPWTTEIEYPGREFYWEGNDGSRIFTCRPFLLPSDLTPADLASEFRSPRLSYYRDLIALAGADVAGSPDTLEVLRRLLDSESGLSSVPVRFSEAREAIEVVRLGIPPDSVTVWRDELVMRGEPVPQAPSRFDTRREVAVVGLQTAEAVSAIVSGLPGGPAYPGDRLRRTWRQVLSDSSAGLPADSGGSVRAAAALAMDDSAAATTDSIIQTGFGVLRAQMDTRSEGGASYVLFNPLGHARSGPALIEFSTPTTGGEPESARRERGLVLVDVPEVPAYGAVTIPIESDGLPRIQPSRLSPPSAGDSWMENAFLRVEIDPRTGAITRILDKANRRQALRPGGRANVLWVTDEVQAERTGPDGISAGTRQEVVRVLSLSASVSPRAATITILRQWGSSTIHQELVLGRTAPFLDIRTRVVWSDDARQLSVEFEPTVSPDSATWEIPYGTIARASAPETKDGHPPFMMAGPRWADVSADGYGFSVLGASASEWDYRAGIIALRLSPARNAAAQVRGSEPLSFRFALYPHAGDWSEAGTQRLAAEYQV
ncbi:MAG: glycoside hydrolase family 38 C-terminal domain-containing protein, partial [Gemmatimonadota bacterium]